MTKKLKAINLDKDVADHQADNVLIENFSKCVNDLYRKEYMNEEKIQKEIKEANNRLESLKNQLIGLKEADALVTSEEKSWITENLPGRLAKGATFEGIYCYFSKNIEKKWRYFFFYIV